MRYVKTFLRFWYDFIVGDDWVIAVGVIATLGATHWLAQNQINAWWLMLAAVVVLLAISLRRETRKVR